MENKLTQEVITCQKCETVIAKQFRGETVKRIEIQTPKKGRISNTTVGLPGEYLEKGYLKIPIYIECPICGMKNSMSFIVESLLGMTFSYKGGCVEIINGKKRKITEERARKHYKIYLKLK